MPLRLPAFSEEVLFVQITRSFTALYRRNLMVQGLFCYVMQKMVFCFSICIFSYSFLKGQSYFSRLLETPYPYVGVIWGSIETPDSGFILMHTSFDIFEDTNKINIVKINKNGETVWAKSYGTEGTAHEQYEIIRTHDSCYIFCGGEQKDLTYSAMLFKINEQGDSIWMKTYNSGFYLGFFNKVVETTNHDLICIGSYDKTPVNGPDPWRQIYIVRTDKDGNLKWQKNYGSASLNDNGRDIVETPEGDFICSGYVRYPYSTNDFFVYSQIIKIDSIGNIKWVKNYSHPDYWQGLIEINKTLDGNYLATGEYNNNRYTLTSDPNGTGGILLKIDSDGNTLWFKRYGDEILDAGCYDFVELPDSSIVTVGVSYLPHAKAKMVKFDGWGEILSVYPYRYNMNEFGDQLFTVLHTKDNGFLLTGHGANRDTINPLIVSKGWILKVDSLGCEIPVCITSSEEPEPTEETKEFTIFPNPGSGAVEVRWSPETGTGLLEVFNLNGMRLVQQQVALQSGTVQLSLDGRPAGIYVVRLRTASGSLARKLVIE
jgi:Secretion system C-terminal sorting domain